MNLGNTVFRIAEALVGGYLMLPGPEDAATLGVTALPSATIGGIMIADAFGVKLW